MGRNQREPCLGRRRGFLDWGTIWRRQNPFFELRDGARGARGHGPGTACDRQARTRGRRGRVRSRATDVRFARARDRRRRRGRDAVAPVARRRGAGRRIRAGPSRRDPRYQRRDRFRRGRRVGLGDYFAELARVAAHGRQVAFNVYVAARSRAPAGAVALETAPADGAERMLAALARTRRVVDEAGAAAWYAGADLGGSGAVSSRARSSRSIRDRSKRYGPWPASRRLWQRWVNL